MHKEVKMLCSGPMNQAKRNYLRGTIGIMLSYMGLVFASVTMVHRWHPQGWHLWLTAGLPTLPIVGLAFVLARYLRDEKDEYQRDMTIQSLLWGTAVALAISVFDSFLGSYGAGVELPRFLVFLSFWVTVAITRAVQSAANRGGADDESPA